MSLLTPVVAHIESVWQRLRVKCAVHPRLCLLALLLAWTLVVRLPFSHVLGDDEAFFSVVASRWLRGELPYVDSYDIKAPGIFAVLAMVQAVFGAGLIQIKGIEIAFVAWGAYGLYRMLSVHGTSRMAFWAAGLYPVYSLFQQGVNFPTQLVQMALTIEAFRFMLDREAGPDARKSLWLAALSGLMIGCAVMVKQTTAFEGLILFGWLSWVSWRQKELRPLLIFCSTAAGPVILFGAYFAVNGHFSEAFDDVVLSAFQRSQLDMWTTPDTLHLGYLRRLTHYPAMLKPILVLTSGALLAWLRLPRIRTVLSVPLLVLSVGWYIAATASILILNSPALYCGFPLLAPTLIFFSAVLCHGIDFKPQQRAFYTALFITAAIIQPVIMEKDDLFLNGFNGIPDYKGNVLAADSLKAHGLKPGDNVLVLSRGHYIYLFTETLPQAKYFNAMHLLCPFPTPDADPLAMALDSQPQYIVMSDVNVMIGCVDLKRMPYLFNRLNREYKQVSSVRGDWDAFNIYERRSGH